MNVLELCLSPGLGGLELYVFNTAQALTSLFNTNKDTTTAPSKVFVVLDKDSKLDKYFQQNSDLCLQNIKRRTGLSMLLDTIKLAKIIDNNKIDTVHIHWKRDLPLSALAKIISKRHPTIIYTRHMMITRKKDDFYHNFLHEQMNLMLTISKDLEQKCKQFIPRYAKKITTLYHGVKEPDVFLDNATRIENKKNFNFTADDFIVGMVGRLERNKGQHLLISAISAAKDHGHNIKAFIIGHETVTGYRDTLKQQANNLDIKNRIHFEDFSQQPQQLMQLCDCIVLATENETFGLVLPEAMRAGVAVIGSDSGGVPEIIEHNNTGLLFKTNDSDDLYTQIEKLFLDSVFKSKLAAQGKKSADERFNDHTHFRRLTKYLQSTLN